MSHDPTSPAPAAPPPEPDAAEAAAAHRRALLQLQLVVAGDESLGRALHRIADLSARSIDGVDQVSVTLVRGGVGLTAAFSGATAAALDERQYEAGFGPCLEAARSGRPVLVPSVQEGAAGAFEGFARQARRARVSSATALPLLGAHTVHGALNTYTRGAQPLGGDELASARAFAAAASAAVGAAVTYAAALQDAADMRAALDGRAGIEQAKGVLMCRLGVDAEAAFAELRRRSQHGNRKLRDITAEVVSEAAAGRPG